MFRTLRIRHLHVPALLAMGCLLAMPSFADEKAKPPAQPATPAKAAEQPAVPPSALSARPAGNPFAPTAPPRTSLFMAAPATPAFPQEGEGPQSAYPNWVPVNSIHGVLGMFTVEHAYMLPTRGFSFSTGVNKFGRMPGSVTVLEYGLNAGVGVRDWLNFYVQFDPHRHTHVSNPSQLSLRTPNNPFTNPQFENTMFRRMGPGLAPAYVEDFPFAAFNDGGVGEVVLGAKFRLFSEQRGDPFSFSIRNDFLIPTRIQLGDLIENGTQTGQFNYRFNLAASRTVRNWAIFSGNAGFQFTRDPRSSGQRLFKQADFVHLAAGITFRANSRFQPMVEFTGLAPVGPSTPNTSVSSRSSVDGVFGFRLYATHFMALDVGYRRMVTLGDLIDKNGFVIKLGASYWPPKPLPPPNRAPTAACSASAASVFAGSNDQVTVRAQASDPDGDSINYSWAASGGNVTGMGAEVRWASAGLNPGAYTVTARVDDGKGGTASCAVDIRVEPRPNRAPMLSCSVDRSSVLVGERVSITGTASDPDGDALTYTWRSNGGQVLGSGANITLDTTGLAPGQYTVTGRVEDGKGAAADCSVGVGVTVPAPPPQASKINECTTFSSGAARVDNVCKRILDDIALRLQSDPNARVVIVGYADPSEPRASTLSTTRATNAQAYLVEKGIATNRIDVRTAGGQAGATNNRRVDIIWVPQGASY